MTHLALDPRVLPLLALGLPVCLLALTRPRSVDDVPDRFLGGRRDLCVHVVEPHWLPRLRTTEVFSYRMPEETFVQNDDRFWISPEPVEPLELVELGDLVAHHEAAGIELRTEPRLLAFWDGVISSTLGFSGIRLRSARLSA